MIMSRTTVTTSGAFVQVCDQVILSSTAASVTAVTVAPANDNRIHLKIFNDSTAAMFVAWGTGVSTTAFTVKIPPAGFYEMPRAVVQFVGPITAVWSAANGAARVTEVT